MQTNYRLPIYLTAAIAIILVSFVAVKKIAMPLLQNKARTKIQSWVKDAPVDITFKDVKILWNGVRIVKMQLKRGVDSLSSSVDVTFGLDSSFPFLKPSRVTLYKPRIKFHRPGEGTGTSGDKNPSPNTPRPLEDLLDRYFSAGISVNLRKADIEVLGRNGETLLRIPEFTADLNAKDRTAQVSSRDFEFKGAKVLSELSGQFILQKQREFYPFLLEARDPGGEPWALKGQVSHDFDTIDINHKRKGIPAAWSDRIKVVGNPLDVKLLLRAKVDGLLTREQIAFDVRFASTNLFLTHESLGKKALGPWPVSIFSSGFFLPEKGTFNVSKGDLFLKSQGIGETLSLAFEAYKSNLQSSMKSDPFRIRFHGRQNNCQAILDAVPSNVLPLLKGLKLEGKFSLDGEINLLSQDDILKFTPGLNQMSCKVIKSPVILTRQWLFTPSNDIPPELRKNPALVAIKLGRPIPRAHIPDDFFKGLVAAEDAKFWRHDGILIDSLLAALERNVKAGHVVVGGSTITMQLAKNLYLDREKVISRKLQEMALAWVLEQNLSKSEILELYANAVEFAPDTYGISKASALYFNKEPVEMSTAESLFLASILPSPTRNYSESYCQARLSKGLKNRMLNVATGLATLSQERDFMKIYAQDLGGFTFGQNLQGCDLVDRSRLSRGTVKGIKRF